MSADRAQSQADDAEAPEETTALGTGAREAVDGDLTKSYIPDDVSPSATTGEASTIVTGDVQAPDMDPATPAYSPTEPSPTAGDTDNPA